jgi:hypothetical protein
MTARLEAVSGDTSGQLVQALLASRRDWRDARIPAMKGVAAAAFLALALPPLTLGALGADVVMIQRAPLQFAGTVANQAAGEKVEVEFRRCEFGGWRLVGGATTASGGAWFVEIRSFPGGGSGFWRARWRNETSNVIRDLHPFQYNGYTDRRGRLSFTFYAGDSTQYMGGRAVQLQRKTAAGTWVLVRTTRLTRIRGYGYVYRATFVVRTRGLRLRLFVPARTAAPCFRAWAGPEIRS